MLFRSRRAGKDVTLAAVGLMVPTALRAASILAGEGIDVEVVDMRTVAPLDRQTLCTSAAKTRRLVVADPSWRSGSVAGEIITSVVEEVELKSRPARVCLPDSHTPMSQTLEAKYYPSDEVVAGIVREVCHR